MQQSNAELAQDIYQNLRLEDPLNVVNEQYDDRQHVERLEADIAVIGQILHSDETLSAPERQELLTIGSDVRLDWLYAKHGGQSLEQGPFSARFDEATNFLSVSWQHALEHRDEDPRPLWDASSKLLDLRALQAYRNAREARTTLAGTQAGERVWSLADSQLRGVITDSTKLMTELEAYAIGDSVFGKKAAGTVYEVLLTAYARLKLYETERFDETFVRGSLTREDRPKLDGLGLSTAFDIVIQGVHNTALLQAKNGKVKQRYQLPIHVVKAKNSNQLIKNITRYIEDFKVAIDNAADPEQVRAIEAAYQELEDMFDSQMAELYAA